MNSQNKKSIRNPEDDDASRTGPLTLEEATITGPITSAADQSRKPENLQSLLKFALEAIDCYDPLQETYFAPMEDERKKFLNEALNSLTVSMVKEIQKSIRILRKVPKLSPEDDPSEYENALEMITENVDDIDIARDFYKVGGFRILKPCLNSPHASIRWKAADLIAALSQNALFCQNEIVQMDILPILLNMVDSDSSDQARIKSLYAVSCTVRGSKLALLAMKDIDGYSTLMKALQSPVEKLKIKAAFLLSSLCNGEEAEPLRMKLIDEGLIEQTIELLSVPDVSPEASVT
ncbi:hsp70-binding protein 1-like isoform X2 [Diachasmimorpha longicaudata]|uniref:hsp70-binding protein 1-like isoform X2 n=1 Tax=Diachasmimorpha longicaudata TaxID=58733 RepID=UPI0030B87AA5